MNKNPVCKILIVDDVPESRYLLDTMLSELEDVELVHAESGEEALSCIMRERFALMLLDVNMPGMDGYEVASYVSKNVSSTILPIVMVTGEVMTTQRLLDAYSSGAVDYINKPIEPQILLSKVRLFVSLYRAHEKAARLFAIATQTLDEVADIKEEKETILNTAGEGIITVSADGFIQYANAKACLILRSNLDVLCDQRFNDWFIDERSAQCFESLSELLERDGGEQRCRLVVTTAEGNSLPVESVCTFANTSSKTTLIVVFQDITERLRMENRLMRLANYDPLTGLTNRAYFQESLTRAIARSKRSGSTLGLMMVDLDKFKNINDTLGHDTGDALLQAVAVRLRNTVRDSDIISRLGGDEFAVITEYLHADESDGRKIAAKLVAELGRPYDLRQSMAQSATDKEAECTEQQKEERLLIVECSVGIAFCREGVGDVTTLVKHADMALYAAKAAGRNTYKPYQEAMSDHTREQVSIENRLRLALKNDELTLFFQPQVCLSQQRVTGFEALVRWFPSGGGEPVSPTVFIPVAEESRLINVLGAMVLEKACEKLSQWQSYFEKMNLTLSVNLSAKQICTQAFIDELDEICARYPFDKKRLCFEITETAVLEHLDYARATMEQIKNRGYGLSLDDFGTGYSSLRYLQELPFDSIKIDRCFIKEIHTSSKSYALVQAIQAIANTFSLQLIAEGVENSQQLDTLISLHCDKVQGFYFSKPMAIPVVEALLQQGGDILQGEDVNLPLVRLTDA